MWTRYVTYLISTLTGLLSTTFLDNIGFNGKNCGYLYIFSHNGFIINPRKNCHVMSYSSINSRYFGVTSLIIEYGLTVPWFFKNWPHQNGIFTKIITVKGRISTLPRLTKRMILNSFYICWSIATSHFILKWIPNLMV